MDAKTRNAIFREGNTIVFIQKPEFDKLKTDQYKLLIKPGTLVMSNEHLYIWMDYKFHHLKFCGCDSDCLS